MLLSSYFASIQTGLAGGVIAGISVGVIAGLLLLGFGIYVGYFRPKKVEEMKLLSQGSKGLSAQDQKGTLAFTCIPINILLSLPLPFHFRRG